MIWPVNRLTWPEISKPRFSHIPICLNLNWPASQCPPNPGQRQTSRPTLPCTFCILHLWLLLNFWYNSLIMFIAILRKCVDVPKEVCVLVRTNPRTVKRPLVKKWCGPDPNVSDNPMTHPVWFLWGAVNNHYVLPIHNNPVRAFIMLLAQEVSKSHKPLLTVPQKRCPLSNIMGVFIHPCISSCERLSQSDGRSSRISLRKLKHFECRLRDVL